MKKNDIAGHVFVPRDFHKIAHHYLFAIYFLQRIMYYSHVRIYLISKDVLDHVTSKIILFLYFNPQIKDDIENFSNKHIHIYFINIY